MNVKLKQTLASLDSKVLVKKSRISAPRKLFKKQSGATLIVTIMLMLVLTILALSLYQYSTIEERSARNQYDRNIAMQAAETALRDAEVDLRCQKLDATVPPTYKFCTPSDTGNCTLRPTRAFCGPPLSTSGFSLTPTMATAIHGAYFNPGCVGTNTHLTAGLCQTTDPLATPWTTTPATTWGNGSTTTVALGTFTGVLPITDVTLAQQPRYMIESIAIGTNPVIYRITARGWGMNQNTQVTVQAIYRP